MRNERIPALTPLADDPRVIITTGEACQHLCLRPQTLRSWACFGNGPISPVRIGVRLGWRVADLKALLAGEGAAPAAPETRARKADAMAPTKPGNVVRGQRRLSAAGAP